MRSIDGVEAWARDPANRTRDGGSWSGWCASFVYRAGGFTEVFENAILAGDASGPLDPDPTTARRGEIHYWAGVGGNGHTCFELGGGLLLMASGSVTDAWGQALGTISEPLYRLKGIPYRGHTFRHGSETLAAISAASGGSTPLEWDEMASKDEIAQVLRDVLAESGQQAQIFNAVWRSQEIPDEGNPERHFDPELRLRGLNKVTDEIRDMLTIGVGVDKVALAQALIGLVVTAGASKEEVQTIVNDAFANLTLVHKA